MHTLIERGPQSPLLLSRSSQGFGTPSKLKELVIVLICIFLAAMLAFGFLPRLSASTIGEAPMSSPEASVPTTPRQQESPLSDKREAVRSSYEPHEIKHPRQTTCSKLSSQPTALEGWGYNKERNVPRLTAILAAIASDYPYHCGNFSLVDYGSDQGYFSISIARAFPRSMVMGLELGGVGGEIWLKKGKGKGTPQDVLVKQESVLATHNIKNMLICQTRVLPRHFFDLNRYHLSQDYQLILSVFHWFDLPTKKKFEETIVAAFKNARTTFIELPTIGDDSLLIRKQVGYKNFVKWYDGRTDIRRIILDSCEAHSLAVEVQEIVAVKWVNWKRIVYRVDLRGEDVQPAHFDCEKRKDIYGCQHRTLFQDCFL